MSAILRWQLCFLFFLSAGISANEQALTDFDIGIAAFKQGQYATAIEAFERAENHGMNSPALLYNLGVAHYRNKDAASAVPYFSALTDIPASAHLAWYNLGLVALVEQDQDSARLYFQHVMTHWPDTQVGNLARLQLQRLEDTPEQTTLRSSTLFSLSGGHEQNIDQLPTQQASRDSDTYGEGFVAVSAHPINDRVRLFATLYHREYQDNDDFNLSQLRGGFDVHHQHNQWRLTLTPQTEWLYWGGELLESNAGAAVSTRYSLTKRQWIDSHYRYLRHQADNNSGYAGDSHRFGVEFRDHSLSMFSWRIGWRFTQENRDGIKIGDEFYTLAVDRHLLSLRLNWRLNAKWQGTARLDYRQSDYHKAHRLFDTQSEQVQQNQRRDDRYSLSIRGDYFFNRNLGAFMQYVWQDNQSSIERFDYQRSDITLGLEWHFY